MNYDVAYIYASIAYQTEIENARRARLRREDIKKTEEQKKEFEESKKVEYIKDDKLGNLFEFLI